MQIQLASDLHLEHLQRKWPGERLIAPLPDADVLVLAGDIAGGADAFKLFSNWRRPGRSDSVPVIYVAGNHEFYGQSIEPMREKMREAASHSSIHFLENESVVIGDVRFLGSTLWTDYRLWQQYTQNQLMERAQSGLNDHQLIQCDHRRFSAQDALNRHEITRAWLQTEITKPFTGKTVVVSHHAPHPLSVHPRFDNDPLTAAFVSDLSDLMPGVDLWLHGHVHDGFDYQVERCRTVANPAGYVLNRAVAVHRNGFDFENKHFNPKLLIQLDA